MISSKAQNPEIDDKELLTTVRGFEESFGSGDSDAHYLLLGDVQERKTDWVKGVDRPRRKE